MQEADLPLLNTYNFVKVQELTKVFVPRNLTDKGTIFSFRTILSPKANCKHKDIPEFLIDEKN